MYLDREMAEKIPKFYDLFKKKRSIDSPPLSVRLKNGRRGERGARNHAALERAFLRVDRARSHFIPLTWENSFISPDNRSPMN
jgi:hypothetical protein